MKRWEFERPVDCESCKAQGNHANTPRIIVDDLQGITENYPLKGAIACHWCGYEVTAPTLQEAIFKWHRFQEVIRLGYAALKDENILVDKNEYWFYEANSKTVTLIEDFVKEYPLVLQLYGELTQSYSLPQALTITIKTLCENYKRGD